MLALFYRCQCLSYLVFACCILHYDALIAQRSTISFEHFTSEQGLSAPVTHIVQDQYGFMWLGTSDGLNRFDGRNFVVYRNIAGDTASLANNIINALCTDHLGHVWAATNGGICFYDFEDDAFHNISFPDSLEKLDQHRVHAVAPDEDGNMWFATLTHIHRWHEGQALKSIKVPGDHQMQIKFLYADKKHNLWIGTESAIIRYQISSGNFTQVIVSSPFTLQHHYSATVHPILPYNGDTLIIGSWYGGLQKVFPSGSELKCIPYIDQEESDQRKHIIRGLCPGQDGNFWIGTYGDGLSIFNSKTSKFTGHYHHDPSNSKSLSDDYTNDVFMDNTGILWIGTDVGLDKYDPFTQQFQSIRVPIPTNEFSVYRVPSSFVEDSVHPDKLWFTISGAGLYEYDTHTDDFILHHHDPADPNSLPDNSIFTVYPDRQGHNWVGMRSGVCIADDHFTKFSRLKILDSNPVPGVFKILQDRDNSLWFATHSNGVYHFNETTNQLTGYVHDDADPNSLPDNRVFCILLDHNGMLWIGTQNRGLCRLHPGTKEIINFAHDKKDPGTIPDNGIYDLLEDNDHFLWIATENGLAKMNLNDYSIVRFSTKDGLSNNDIFSITADQEGFYWLTTNNGICRFDPRQMTFKNYFISDGLPTNSLTSSLYYSRNGTLYLGTSGMITYCKPDKMQMNRHMPSVVITNFKVFDAREPVMREGPDLQPIQLSYRKI